MLEKRVMHRLYPLVLLLLFVHGAAAREQIMLVRVTAYWHSPGSKERLAASGPLLRDGHCAVDPKKIPYGSKIVLPDEHLIAVDTGPAVVQRIAARRSGQIGRASCRERVESTVEAGS